MISIPIGVKSEMSVRPKARDLASSIGNSGVSVVSTPSVIGFLEHVSHLAIQPYFHEDQVSVGTKVNVEHVGAATRFSPLLCTAQVISIQGRRISFEVCARQDDRVIMSGTHERAVVRKSKFNGDAADDVSAPKSEPEALTFWFDFHSPWSYLAATRVNGLIAQHGVKVRWRPLHLANLIDRIDGRRVLEENPSFLSWYKQDMQDWAEIYGLSIRYHPDFPIRPSRALRASLYAAEAGAASAFVVRVMRAYWEEAADISDLDVLGRLAHDVGLPSAAVMAAAQTAAYKETLAANTEEAIRAGVFGVPSFVWRGKIFFGNDRIAMLDRYLGGDTIDRFAAGLP